MVPRHVDGRHRFGTGGGLRTILNMNVRTCAIHVEFAYLESNREGGPSFLNIEFARMHSSISKATCMRS